MKKSAFKELQERIVEMRRQQLDQLKRDNLELRARLAIKKANLK